MLGPRLTALQRERRQRGRMLAAVVPTVVRIHPRSPELRAATRFDEEDLAADGVVLEITTDIARDALDVVEAR